MADKPVRKVAKETNDMLARPVPGSNTGLRPVRKTATAYGKVDKSAYVRKPAGVNATNHDINRSAGDAAQPHNNKGNSSMSNLKKGAD